MTRMNYATAATIEILVFLMFMLILFTFHVRLNRLENVNVTETVINDGESEVPHMLEIEVIAEPLPALEEN